MYQIVLPVLRNVSHHFVLLIKNTNWGKGWRHIGPPKCVQIIEIMFNEMYRIYHQFYEMYLSP